MEEEIQKLKEIISRLEYHFDKYSEHKYQSKNASRKPDRDKAHKSMISSAEFIENLLISFNGLSNEISNLLKPERKTY